MTEPPWEPLRRVVQHDSAAYQMRTRIDRALSAALILFGLVLVVLFVQMVA